MRDGPGINCTVRHVVNKGTSWYVYPDSAELYQITGRLGANFAKLCPIRGITRQLNKNKDNSPVVKFYFTSDEPEYNDPNETGASTYFASAGEAEAAGFVVAHAK